jgi:hypothetical protein
MTEAGRKAAGASGVIALPHAVNTMASIHINLHMLSSRICRDVWQRRLVARSWIVRHGETGLEFFCPCLCEEWSVLRMPTNAKRGKTKQEGKLTVQHCALVPCVRIQWDDDNVNMLAAVLPDFAPDSIQHD